jgi:hypothetical protein
LDLLHPLPHPPQANNEKFTNEDENGNNEFEDDLVEDDNSDFEDHYNDNEFENLN